MDKELLKKYNLQEAVKRFQQINEYTFITSPMIAEDGEDEEEPQQDAAAGGQDQGQQGMETPAEGPQMPAGQQDASQGETDGSGMQEPAQAGGNAGMGQGGIEEGGEEETVVDVDDLTNSQEATEYKIDGVDDKLTRMLSVLDKFNSALDATDKKIDDLRKEFEIRNPSEQEKLNIRSQASYPYAETPKGFWEEKKAANPHYNVIYDNDVPTADEQKKFEITRDDVKNFNTKEISDSFDFDDMKLDDFVKF